MNQFAQVVAVASLAIVCVEVFKRLPGFRPIPCDKIGPKPNRGAK